MRPTAKIDLGESHEAGNGSSGQCKAEGTSPRKIESKRIIETVVSIIPDECHNLNTRRETPLITPVCMFAAVGILSDANGFLVQWKLGHADRGFPLPSTIQTELIKSILAEDILAVSALLEAGADVNAVTVKENIYDHGDGRTPLTIAAELGNATLIRCLLEHGAEISRPSVQINLFGTTPLMYAAYSGDYDSVKLLLSWGANVHAKARGGNTALMSAASRGDYASVKLLLSWGAEVNAKTDIGVTALMRAAYNGRNLVVRTLLRVGADINARAEGTFPGRITTPLISAAGGGHDMTVYLLLRQGAKNTGEEGLTALRMSQAKGFRAIARMLRSAQHSGSV